jgi:hypothetical protein
MLCHSLNATPSKNEISVLQPRAEIYGQLGQQKWPTTQKLWIDNVEDAGSPTLPFAPVPAWLQKLSANELV